jgi:ketosteroid isomerase-like protein
MTSEQLSQAERNKAAVSRAYAALGRHDFAAAGEVLGSQEMIELNYSHPAGGVFHGADVGKARQRFSQLTGFDGVGTTIDEVIADGPTRVIALITNEGNGVDGKRWSMTCIHVLDVVDEKIINQRVFFQDTALLRDIAVANEAKEQATVES